ncbi:putative NAD-specific glutamate dehydrogenase [Xanthomonas citri pv. malvacearum str. GSPB1386]|nr:putative NAD-specific glutamate dehydrogenase [Xanthomonas citri pv. malvacearum str. GSPB2388]EKQ64771.1 putative NAD-specific glutamate dehydrogenase [Xanthomonas citri pv. malvacearum str. GSPB1386]
MLFRPGDATRKGYRDGERLALALADPHSRLPNHGLLLVVLDLGELGVHHVIGGLGGLGVAAGRIGVAALLCCRSCCVQRLAGFFQRLGARFDLRLVVALHGGFQIRQRRFHLADHIATDLAAMLGDCGTGSVDQTIGLVAGLHQLLELLVFFAVGFRVGDHALDLFIRQTRTGLDLDLLFLVGLLVLGRHVQDAVGVDVEGHFHLRHAARRRLDAGQVELGQRLVEAGLLALTLQHVHGHGRLVVFGGGEGLRGLGRDRGVLFDDLGEHAAHGLDAQRQRGHVQQQHVLDVAGQHAALDRRTHGHGFVRVDVLARFLAEEIGNCLLHLRHTGLAADQDHFVDVAGAQAGVVQRGAARLDRLLDQVFHQRFELGTGQLDVEVLGARGIGGDVRQVHFGLLAGRQLDLGALCGVLQALQRQRILAQIDTLILVEFIDQVLDDAVVEIFAAQEGVAIGGQHFELLLAIDFSDFDDRDVEGAAAQVVHGNLAVAAVLVQAIGQRCGGRLVDDALDVQTGDAAGILGGLTLAVVEVRRHRDHRLGDLLAEEVFGGLLHLFQHARGDFLRRHALAVAGLHPGVAIVVRQDAVRHVRDVLLHFAVGELAADQALHRVEGVLRVGHGLALGRSADQHFAVLGVGDDRRRGAIALGVFNDAGLAAVHDRHARVRGAEVNTNDLAHGYAPDDSVAVSGDAGSG